MLIDEYAKQIYLAQKEYTILIKQTYYAEQSLEDIWNKTKECILEITTKYKKECSNIISIGFSGQMHALVIVDKNINPIRDAIIWLDQRAQSTIEDIYNIIPRDKLHSITLNRLSTGFALPSLLWIRENEKSNYSKIYKILAIKDFIRYKLTKILASDYSDMSAMMFLDTSEMRYSLDLLDALDISINIMPELYEACFVVGNIDDATSKETGLSTNTTVCIGGGDQSIQTLTTLFNKDNSCAINIGTSTQLSLFSKSPIYDNLFRSQTFCHVKDKGYTIYAAILSGGLSLKWFKNNFFEGTTYKDLDLIASSSPAGSNGLIYLPYLVGERCPHFDKNAKAMFFGLTIEHNKSHFLRAIMEAAVFSLKEGFDIFNNMGLKMDNIICSGGGSFSSLWKHIIADILDRPVFILKNITEEAAFGAAMISMIGSKKYSTYDEAIKNCIKISDEAIYPNNENTEIYKNIFDKYKMLYQVNKGLF